MNKERLLEWKEMSDQLKQLKYAELKVRKELVIDIFGGSTVPEKRKFELDGLLVEAETKISYSVDEESVKSMYEELTDIDKEAIKWSPGLKLIEYKKLPASSLLHECITSKPAAPTLKVTETI